MGEFIYPVNFVVLETESVANQGVMPHYFHASDLIMNVMLLLPFYLCWDVMPCITKIRKATILIIIKQNRPIMVTILLV